MRKWAWLGVAAMLAGCPDPAPTPYPGDTRQTCAQLGWRCGVDDYGASCGSCTSPQTCNGNGACVSSGPGPCTPSCADAACGGSDRCGGRCVGSCPSGQRCDAGNLACVPTSTGPTVHEVAAGRTPLFNTFHGIPFTVPAATLGYAVSSPTDTFTAGIFTATEWANYSAGGQGRAYALRENIRTANETTVPLPAGNYVLGFRCRNLVERCVVIYTASAYY